MWEHKTDILIPVIASNEAIELWHKLNVSRDFHFAVAIFVFLHTSLHTVHLTPASMQDCARTNIIHRALNTKVQLPHAVMAGVRLGNTVNQLPTNVWVIIYSQLTLVKHLNLLFEGSVCHLAMIMRTLWYWPGTQCNF